jgi:flagellin
MSRTIQNNAGTQVRKHERAKQTSSARLASGQQINKASEGAAEIAAAAKLTSASRSLAAATSNARRALAFGQIADGSLAQIQEEVIRIKELATAASSDTFDAGDREKAQSEVAKRISTIDSVIVATTRFGDTVVLDGSGGSSADGLFKFQIAEKSGDEVQLDLTAKYDAATLGIDGADVSTYDNAQTAIGLCDTAIGLLNTGRAAVGAFMAGMESTVTVNDVKQGNIDEAIGVLTEADLAKEATNLAMADIKAQMAQSMIVKENQAAANVVGLVR